MPFFSVILPTYNRALFLPKAIESVLTQTFEDWELVIVDDGSTDNTRDLVLSYNDPRIRYIYQENQERSAARNNGIKQSTGQYICFLDSDDYFLPERLLILHKYIVQKPNIGFYFTSIVFDNNGKLQIKPTRSRGKENVFDFIALEMIGTPQVIIHNQLLQNTLFNPNWKIGEDLELWLRLATKVEPNYIDNSANIVATEHDSRSISFKLNNAGKDQLKLLKFIFNKTHPGNRISQKVKRELLANSYFLIFKFWLYRKSRPRCIFFLFKSILINPFCAQLKLRLNVLLKLLFGYPFERIKNIIG